MPDISSIGPEIIFHVIGVICMIKLREEQNMTYSHFLEYICSPTMPADWTPNPLLVMVLTNVA